MLAQNEQRKLALITTITFWSIILGGIMVTPLSYVIAEGIINHDGIFYALWEFYSSLFVFGYNYFSIMVYGAIPFMILAFFALINLSIVIESDKEIFHRRTAGVMGSMAAAVIATMLSFVSLMTSSDAQAALGFLVVPFPVFLAMPVGYLAGRIIWKRKLHSSVL